MRPTALVLVALALAGCESTQEKSAQLERAAKLAPGHSQIARAGLSITRESAYVKVVEATVLHSSEGAAAVVTVRNDSGRTLKDVPIAIAVRDPNGRTLFQNDAAGLEAALVSVPSLPANGELAWVDDQVPITGEPTTVSARVGEGTTVAGSPPVLTVTGVHPLEESANGAGATGTVSNRSSIAQKDLVVYAVARRDGTIVAAGRAVLPSLASDSSATFQAFFIGSPRGAQLLVSAPATTFQ